MGTMCAVLFDVRCGHLALLAQCARFGKRRKRVAPAVTRTATAVPHGAVKSRHVHVAARPTLSGVLVDRQRRRGRTQSGPMPLGGLVDGASLVGAEPVEGR